MKLCLTAALLAFLVLPVAWSQTSSLPDAPTPQPAQQRKAKPSTDSNTPTTGVTKPDDSKYPFPEIAPPRSDDPANANPPNTVTKPDDKNYPFPEIAPPRSDDPANANPPNTVTKPDDKNYPFPGDEPSAGESSSKSPVDLSPPPGDSLHPGANIPGVTEFHPYDPHRADKDVEVGMFYFKKGNYSAAASRFEEALQWQGNHAEATFRLAQAQEKLGKKLEAALSYRQYLQILPRGAFAPEAQKSLTRLDANTATSQLSETHPK